MNQTKFLFPFFFLAFFNLITAQENADPTLLTVDRIYNSREFSEERQAPIQWIENGDAYIIVERNSDGQNELVRYESGTQKRSLFLSKNELTPANSESVLRVENFTMSDDKTKILIFTNSSRVWRSNTKGDYWVYDFSTKNLSQIGKEMPSSSLMFAKFSADNQYVAYVQNFNIYKEEFKTGKVTQLTFDGSRAIINGTFDWVYEEEFGCRDGFSWSQDGKKIAFWQLDASDIGTHHMINNTDSIYPKLIPLQYPKVGEDPSACKVGFVDASSAKTTWIPIPGGAKENYIPGMQWVNSDLLLIQQMNRKQNKLTIWKYRPSNGKLSKIYTETEKTWVDISYPDISASGWSGNDLVLADKGKSFLRMTENDGWRHVYKINIKNGKKTLLTKGDYDVASMKATTKNRIFFIASPTNPTQRYLYSVGLDGRGDSVRITPKKYSGVNNYNVSPNGRYAIHSHSNASTPNTVRFVGFPGHRTIKTLVKNEPFNEKLNTLALPEISFFKVKTEEGIELDGRMIKPINFDPNKKYPVIYNVYGEPWGQTATDAFVGLWNILLAQQGYLVLTMDNRGTPSLKGSEWRKSIYRKIGVINAQDQGLAAKEIKKWDFVDSTRTAVWGWSGGGSMTLNLLFQFPEIYQTGMSVAPVSNQLIYDNIYQERYMGLPQENMQDFVAGSPITHAKNLEGNLLLIHGTADDNVHYQSAELLVNELIKYNKQFQMFSYPNRSHGIYEGDGTRRHLYGLLLNYLKTNTKAGGVLNEGRRP